MMNRRLPLLAALLASSLAFAQAPKKVLFDHTGHEDGGVSAYWIIDTHEPNPSPANPVAETDWNGGISCWAFDLLNKGYTVQTLPASGGRITYNDGTNAQDLKNYSVFVIPERYTYFTTAEKQAIVAFVQAGGGLYLMGNHDGATRVTSTVPGSTDAFHVFNDLLATDASGFGFTFVDGHGPSDPSANTTTTAITAGTGAIEQALTHGPNGLMTAMDFHSYAYLNLTGSNASAKWIVQTQVSGDPATDYFVVAATYGAGRIVAIGDSSPSDDGTTTTSGKSLIDGYHSNSSKIFHLNATDWLAGSGTTANTVTASITTPSGNVTVPPGISQSFAGSATDSSSSATLTYAWDFGDGTTAAGATASHAFSNTTGAALTRTVTFTATDNTGVSNSATRVITVSPDTAGVVTASITTPSSNVTIASGATQAFAGSATDTNSTATLAYAWNFGDGTTATGASASHVFTNTGTSAISRTVTFTATDNAGITGSATRTVTVNPASGSSTTTQILSNPGFETGTATPWSMSSGVLDNGTSEPAHSGSWKAWLCGYGSTHTDTVMQQATIASNATAASLSFWLHIDTAETSGTHDTLAVQVRNSAGAVLGTLATFSNLNANTGYTQVAYDLSAYKGQTIQINLVGTEDASNQTSFVVDDFALNVTTPTGAPNTVTASITTPSSNVTLASGTAQAFAGTATDSASGQTLTYAWNFGDGSTGSGASASHTYTNTGSSAVAYTATLTATDTTGASGTATRTITVNPAPASNTVTASITTPSSNVTLTSGTAQAFVGTATDSASGQTITYSWNFGDGVTSSGASTSHTYTNTGSSAATYTATLTATDTTGATGTATRTITVNPATTSGSSLTETFDSGTKTAYAAGNVTLTTGTWNLTDALLGSTASDPHDGTQSVRTRNSGTVTMGFDFPTGAKAVTVSAGSYGTDGATTWGLWYSTDGGSTWTEAGSTVTTSSSTLTPSTFTVNVTGAIRFQIRKTDGTSNRVNFDDFQISGY